MGLGHLIPTAQSATTRRAASSTTGALKEKEKRLAEKSALDAIFKLFHIPLHLDTRLLRLLKTKKSIAKLFACNREARFNEATTDVRFSQEELQQLSTNGLSVQDVKHTVLSVSHIRQSFSNLLDVSSRVTLASQSFNDEVRNLPMKPLWTTSFEKLSWATPLSIDN